MNWPIGMGQSFFGIIDRASKTIEPFRDEENILHLNDDFELEVKFNRTQVQNIINPGDITLYISGKINSAAFLGNYTIKVIDNRKMDEENEKYEKDNKNKRGKS